MALQKERIGVGALGEMMAGRMTPDEAIKKIQKYADDTRDGHQRQEVQALTDLMEFDAAPAAASAGRESRIGRHETR